MATEDDALGQTALEEKFSKDSNFVENLDERILSWFKKRNGDTLKGALAFIPWVLQEADFEGALEKGHVVIHRGTGAVVFSDASGFTALTERLSKKSDGAELLSLCLTSFFTPLIDIINSYRGDVIKFSGDALTIYFQAVDDTKHEKYNHVVPPHGTWGLPDLGPQNTAVLRAWHVPAALKSTSGFTCLTQEWMMCVCAFTLVSAVVRLPSCRWVADSHPRPV
eukprot:symbB.v1.2.014171.t1/scaffold972.1/size178526/2